MHCLLMQSECLARGRKMRQATFLVVYVMTFLNGDF